MAGTTPGYVLAIDAGQSSTSCLIGLQDGTLLGCGYGGAAAVPGDEASVHLMRLALHSSVTEALSGVHPRPERLSAAYLSLTGGASVALDYLPQLIPVEKIQAESDAVAALASGAYGGPGVALISGTGCVAYAQNREGKRTIRGGWGYLLGDEGSGFWIGLQAVRAAIRAEDGRGPRTQFTDQVIARLGVPDMRAAQGLIYNESITRPDIARLAPFVMEASDQGDEIAKAIISQAAQELFSLVRATCEAAELNHLEDRIIIATGGLMRPLTPVYRAFAGRVERELPSYRLIPPQLPPVVGAFILGLILSGIDINQKVLEQINTTLANLPAGRLKV